MLQKRVLTAELSQKHNKKISNVYHGDVDFAKIKAREFSFWPILNRFMIYVERKLLNSTTAQSVITVMNIVYQKSL